MILLMTMDFVDFLPLMIKLEHAYIYRMYRGLRECAVHSGAKEASFNKWCCYDVSIVYTSSVHTVDYRLKKYATGSQQ